MALYLYLQFPALQLDNVSIAATSALPLAVVMNSTVSSSLTASVPSGVLSLV
jgi:hypothetical protein